MRCLLLVKQGRREIMRLVHPTAEIPVQLGGRAVPLRVVDAVWGFFAVYVGVFIVLMLSMMATGLGEVASNHASLGAPAKWI